jgi:hypothetical protein
MAYSDQNIDAARNVYHCAQFCIYAGAVGILNWLQIRITKQPR